MNVPVFKGVPLIVIVLFAQFAVTPDGKPVAVPIPFAFVVVCVIFVNGVFTHNVGEEEAFPTVLVKGDVEFTMIVPVAEILPQPPVKGME